MVFDQTSFNMDDQGIPTGTVIFDLADEAVALRRRADHRLRHYAARLQLNSAVKTRSGLYPESRHQGWQLAAAVAVEIDELQHKEEVLNSRTGPENQLANGAARLNATAFYYDYEDYQAFSLTGLTSRSPPDATVSGVKLSCTGPWAWLG